LGERRDHIRATQNSTRQSRPKGDNDYFEQHPSRLQFITSIILVILTIGTLGLTWYYSNKNLTLSTFQYKSAIKQFQYQRRLDSIKNISDFAKEKIAAITHTKDSLIQVKKDSFQTVRNQRQDSLNKKQLAINNEQLTTAKNQAQTLKNQLVEQTKQYKEQFFERRPFFTVDNVNIDSTIEYKPKISFVFTNKGIRTAHVDSTFLAFFNLKLGCHSLTRNTANLESQQQNFLNTSQINIYNDCLKSPFTIFFLLVYYKDFATDQIHKTPIFFQYSFNKQKQFSYSRLLISQVPNEFKRFLENKTIPLNDE
jgi:hypothetical protein